MNLLLEQTPYVGLKAGLSRLGSKLAVPHYHPYREVFELGGEGCSLMYFPRGEQLIVTVPRNLYEGIDQTLQGILSVDKSFKTPQWDPYNDIRRTTSDFMMLTYCGITPEQITALCDSDDRLAA